MVMMKKNKFVICMLLVLLLAVNYATESESACTRRCGDVDVPFPFGIEAGCFATGFQVVCNDSKLYYRHIQLVGIDLDYSEATVLQPIATDCPDDNVAAGRSYASSGINLTGSPFLLSDARNIFTTIGCDAAAFFSTSTSAIGNFSDFNTTGGGGCVSLCNNNATFVDGTCSSNDGCCQTAIRPRAQEFTFYLSNYSFLRIVPRSTMVFESSAQLISDQFCPTVFRGYSFDSKTERPLQKRGGRLDPNSLHLPGRDFYESHRGHVPVDWSCSDHACPNQQRRYYKDTPKVVFFVIISAAAGGSFLIFVIVNTLRRSLKKRNLVKKSKENYPGNLELLKNAESSSDDIVTERIKIYEPNEMKNTTDSDASSS